MSKKTPLYQSHLEANGKIVDFAGWLMPIHYGSQIEEHQHVRQDAGIFDVSHMTIVDVLGPGARDYLRHLLANDIDKLNSRGKALYTCMLNHDGGIIDDLIVYFVDVQHYRVVLNAGTRDRDIKWMNKVANEYSVGLQERHDLAMLAVQGPNARNKVHHLLTPAQVDAASTLEAFEFVDVDNLFIARTGYTGEDGYEIIMPQDRVIDFWNNALAHGIAPCGLGARDTLRLEAGLNLYGADMDETVTPLESNLAWTISWEPADRLFIGRAALELQKSQSVKRKLMGLVLEDKGVLRAGQKVLTQTGGEGIITSGTFSPSLGVGIGMARVPQDIGMQGLVEIRGKMHAVKVIKLPFIRRGSKTFD